MEKKEEPKDLMNFGEGTMPDLMDVVKRRFMEQNADTALKIVSEHRQLTKALAYYEKLMAKLKEGDISVFDDYKKKRKRLEDEDGFEF